MHACADDVRTRLTERMRTMLMWMSMEVVSGVRIVQCHAITDVVIDVRVMQCYHAIMSNSEFPTSCVNSQLGVML